MPNWHLKPSWSQFVTTSCRQPHPLRASASLVRLLPLVSSGIRQPASFRSQSVTTSAGLAPVLSASLRPCVSPVVLSVAVAPRCFSPSSSFAPLGVRPFPRPFPNLRENLREALDPLPPLDSPRVRLNLCVNRRYRRHLRLSVRSVAVIWNQASGIWHPCSCCMAFIRHLESGIRLPVPHASIHRQWQDRQK